MLRDVAQFGSALDWGSRGRWFESSRPDQKLRAPRRLGAFFFTRDSMVISLCVGYHRYCVCADVQGSIVSLKKKIKRELIGTSDYPSNQIFTISNFITVLRLILTLVFLCLFIMDFNRYVALAIYAVAASTDWLDGTIARQTHTVSWLGKVMDPIVDRALLFTGVVGLVVRDELPTWVCVVIIARDIYLAIGSNIVRRYHKRPIDVVYTGKIATALLMIGFSFTLLGLPVVNGLELLGEHSHLFPGLDAQPVPLGILFVYLGVAFSLFTAMIYTIKGYKAYHRAIEHPENEDANFLNPEIVEDEDTSFGSRARG